MDPRVLLSSQEFQLTVKRLCYQLIEKHDFSQTALIGMQPRGVLLCSRLEKELKALTGSETILTGSLDVTFYRDDFRKHQGPIIPKSTKLDFSLEDKSVVLVDDVLFTGRTIRAGLDALLDFGRPKKVELLVLIDRRFSRDLPIQPDYTGKIVDTITSEKVKVCWSETDGEDRVDLLSANTVKA